MLGQPSVEPVHVLLALTRHGNVRRLFGERRVVLLDTRATEDLRGWRAAHHFPQR